MLLLIRRRALTRAGYSKAAMYGWLASPRLTTPPTTHHPPLHHIAAHTAGPFPRVQPPVQSPRDDSTETWLVRGSPPGRHPFIKLPKLAPVLFDSSSQGSRPPCSLRGPGMQVASSPCVHQQPLPSFQRTGRSSSVGIGSCCNAKLDERYPSAGRRQHHHTVRRGRKLGENRL